MPRVPGAPASKARRVKAVACETVLVIAAPLHAARRASRSSARSAGQSHVQTRGRSDGRTVPLHPLRKVILPGERLLLSMVVGITRAVAQVLHQSRRRVKDMRRRHEAACRFGRGTRGRQSRVHGVRFRRRSKIYNSFGDREFALRAAQPLIGFPRGNRQGQGIRISHADILGGETHQTTRQITRILSAIQHPREPIESRIRIRAAQRLMQGGDQVVMLLPVLVVQRGAPREQGRQPGGVERFRVLRQREDLLGHVQQVAPVAIGHGAQRSARVRGKRCRTGSLGLGTLQELLQRGVVQPAQHQNLAAREQRAVQGEKRDFRWWRRSG